MRSNCIEKVATGWCLHEALSPLQSNGSYVQAHPPSSVKAWVKTWGEGREGKAPAYSQISQYGDLPQFTPPVEEEANEETRSLEI